MLRVSTAPVRAQHFRSRRHARSEGAVLLVVMLILLTGTALAAIALQSTQQEVRSAGHDRTALQTQYAAESAFATTLSWVDATCMNGTFYRNHLLGWAGQANAPSMALFGEPEVSLTNRAWANRTQWQQQRDYLPYGVAPLTVPLAVAGAGAVIASDPVGSFGPRNAYVPGNEHAGAPIADLVDYVVDLYDCRQRPVAASPGSQVNQGGSGSLQQVEFYCVMTARGRSYVPGAGLNKSWDLSSGGTYTPSRFMAAHDVRGTIVTPPIIQ